MKYYYIIKNINPNAQIIFELDKFKPYDLNWIAWDERIQLTYKEIKRHIDLSLNEIERC